MRVVVAHSADAGAKELRHFMLGSGLDCGAEDCVPWSNLAIRLGRGDVDVVLVIMKQNSPEAWEAIRQARDLTESPVMVALPARDTDGAQQARRLGVAEVLDGDNLRASLDDAVERCRAQGVLRRRRGKVISVFAPMAGSGATTVAANLAGALARKHPKNVALIELASEFGDLGLLLNMTPAHTVEDVCQRWRSLDVTSLASSFTEHKSGVWALVNAVDRPENRHLDLDAVRRIAVLARVTVGYTVLALDNRLSEKEVEAMRLSDSVVLVVRPDVPSVRRTHWALEKAIAQGVAKERIHLVMNRYGQGGQLPLSHAESTLGMKAMKLIPDDPRSVNRAANRGELLCEGLLLKRISRRFASLAFALNGKS